MTAKRQRAVAKCACPSNKHVASCPHKRGPKFLGTNTRVFKVLSLLESGPMTLGELVKSAVNNFVYADYPGLRRDIQKALGHLRLCGHVVQRGEQRGWLHTNDRKWKIAPAGRVALGKSLVEEKNETVAELEPIGSLGIKRQPLRVVHPSEIIDEEMRARGWDIRQLSMAMVSEGSVDRLNEYGKNHLMIELYFSAGPTNKACRMGQVFIAGLSRALGTTAEFWENLEKQWLASWPSDEATGDRS